MAMEYGEGSIMILILVSGDSPKQKDMEYTHGKMAIDMKESGNNVLSMDKVQIFLQMVISTLVSIKMENQRAKVSIHGLMDHSILENSKTV